MIDLIKQMSSITLRKHSKTIQPYMDDSTTGGGDWRAAYRSVQESPLQDPFMYCVGTLRSRGGAPLLGPLRPWAQVTPCTPRTVFTPLDSTIISVWSSELCLTWQACAREEHTQNEGFTRSKPARLPKHSQLAHSSFIENKCHPASWHL